MPASEWVEWCALLCGPDPDPWGHYRSDALALQMSGHVIAAPHAAKPGEMLKGLRLPWAPRPKDDNIQVISGQQMAMFLQSIGGKPAEVKP